MALFPLEGPVWQWASTRKLKAEQKAKANAEAANRRATDAQMLEDAERLIAAWNERQTICAPMIFSPTIGAAIAAGYWFLWVRCPACRTINAIDLRTLDRHNDAAVTSLIPALSCGLETTRAAAVRPQKITDRSERAVVPGRAELSIPMIRLRLSQKGPPPRRRGFLSSDFDTF